MAVLPSFEEHDTLYDLHSAIFGNDADKVTVARSKSMCGATTGTTDINKLKQDLDSLISAIYAPLLIDHPSAEWDQLSPLMGPHPTVASKAQS